MTKDEKQLKYQREVIREEMKEEENEKAQKASDSK